jgi:ABC-type phosphate transport system substrate-binding protein
MNACRALLTLLFSGALVANAASDPVRVAGTDILGADFSRAFYAGAAAADTDLVLALDGSRPAVEALRSGRADAALISLPAEEASMLLTRWEQQVVAFHCVRVIVPAGSPLRSVTLPQLATIFGARVSGTTRISDASEAGSLGAFTPLAPESGSGVAVDLFRNVALSGEGLRSTIERYRSAAELSKTLATDPNAIALAAGTAPAGARALLLLDARGREIAPTPEALERGDYPLSLAVRIVFPADKRDRVRALVRWLRSEEGKAALARADLVPRAGAGNSQGAL